MKETILEMFDVKKYCPMCDKEHEMKLKVRFVEGCKVSGREVKYVEAYSHCEVSDYEISELKSVKEVTKAV